MHIQRKRKKICGHPGTAWKEIVIFFRQNGKDSTFFGSGICENRQFRSSYRMSVYECERERINRIEEKIFLIKRLERQKYEN